MFQSLEAVGDEKPRLPSLFITFISFLQKSGSSSSSLAGRRSIGTDSGDVDIRECMQSFTREEVLDGDEQPVSITLSNQFILE